MTKGLEAKIITTQEIVTTWEGIQNVIMNGDASEILKERDRIPFVLTDGQCLTAVVAAIRENRVYFVVDECLPDAPMYNRFPHGESVSWSGCDLRAALNGDVLSKLPPELAAVITPRIITQRVKGKTITMEDKLWIPSYTEIVGTDSNGNPFPTDGEDEFHFNIFADERDRVKQLDGETTWYWLRSPEPSSGTGFRSVANSGTANNYFASSANSVCFGFCVG